MARWILSLFFTLSAVFSHSITWANTEAAQAFTYEGRLYDSFDSPLAEAVTFHLQIFNEAEDCLLYEEEQTLDLSTTNGQFVLEVGSITGAAKRTADDPGFAMWQVFQNTLSLSPPVGVCAGAPFNPGLGEKRKLQVSVTALSSGFSETLTPMQTITSAPSSLMSQSLQGIGKDGFIQTDIGTGLNQTVMEDLASQHTELMALAGGTSIQYVSSGGNVSSNLIYSTDQIAVGTATPATGVEFEIRKSDPTIRLSATDGGTGAMEIQFLDTAGEDHAAISVQEGTNALTLSTGGANALTLDASQNANFLGSMTVAGTIRGGIYTSSQEATVLSPFLTGCAAACAGTQWMNSDLDELRYWDGAAMRSVGSYSGALGTAGQVLTSNGPGTAPTWQTATATDNTKLPLDGSVAMTGNLNLGDNGVQNLELGSASAPAMSFNGDADTGLYSAGADSMSFSTGGSSRMTLGNFQADFEVDIDMNDGQVVGVSSGSAANPALSFNGDSDSGFFRPSADGFAITTGGTERVRVDSSGNFGIGATSPAERLDVEGSIVSGPKGTATGEGGAIRFEELAANGTQSVGFRAPDALAVDVLWQLPAGDGNLGQVLSTNGTGVLSWTNAGGSGDFLANGSVPMTGNLRLNNQWLSGDGGNEGVFVDSSGNVGIGESTLSNRFTVNDNSGTAALFSSRDSGGGNELQRMIELEVSTAGTPAAGLGTGILFSGRSSVASGRQLAAIDAVSTDVTDSSRDADLVFSSVQDEAGYGNLTEHMRIQSTGNVGIGITTPAEALHVEGAIRYTGGIKDAIGQDVLLPNGRHIANVGNSSSPSYAFQGDANTGLFRAAAEEIGISTDGNERVRIDANGFVGIGTSTPAAALDVHTGSINAAQICDENNANCLDLSAGVGGSGDFLADGSVDMTGSLDIIDGTVTAPGIRFVGDQDTGLYNLPGNIMFAVDSVTPLILNTNSLYSNRDDAPHMNLLSTSDASLPTYGFYGDTNTGLFSPADEEIAFTNNGSESFRIDSSGNVGIGTDSPAVELDVHTGSINAAQICDENNANCLDLSAGVGGSGDFLADGSVPMTAAFEASSGTEPAPSITFNGDEDTGFYNPAGNTIGFVANGSQIMTFKDTGLGIGGSTGHRLTVQENGGSLIDVMELRNLSGGGDRGASISFYSGTTQSARIGSTRGPNAATGDLHFFAKHDGPGITEVMTYDGVAEGLGIGNISPSEKLDVGGSILTGPKGTSAGDGGAVKFGELAANGTNSVGFRAPDAIATNVLWQLPAADGSSGQVLSTDGSGVLSWAAPGSGGGDILDGGNTTGAALTLGTNDSFSLNFETGGATAMTLDTAGELGIGTTNPTAELHVQGPSTAGSPTILIERTGSGPSRLKLVAADNIAQVGAEDSNDDLALRAGGAEVVRITDAGSVGIGTTGPWGDLNIYGSSSTTQLTLSHDTSSSGQQAVNLITTESGDGAYWGAADRGWSVYARNENYSTTSAQSDFGIGFFDGSGWQNRFFIEHDTGNVGIGNATPEEKLHVRSGNILLDHGQFLRAKRDTGGSAFSVLGFVSDTDNLTMNIGTSSSLSGLNITDSGNNTLMTVKGDGKVGIGAPTPAVELDVGTGTINAAQICDESNANCLDLSAGGSGYTAGDTILFANGSVSAPGIALNSESTTGFYRMSSAHLGMSLGGALTTEYRFNYTHSFVPISLRAENELRFSDNDNSDYVGFKSPATLSGTQIWTLPDGDGTSGQFLSTNGAGVLSWASATGTGDFLADGSVAMTGNLRLGGNYISSNGLSQGLYVGSGGAVGINTDTPEAPFHSFAEIDAPGSTYYANKMSLDITEDVAPDDVTALLVENNASASADVVDLQSYQIGVDVLVRSGAQGLVAGQMGVRSSFNNAGAVGDRYAFYVGPGATHAIYSPTSTTESYLAGNVGIGTANPSAKLHVNGTIFNSYSSTIANGIDDSSIYVLSTNPSVGLRDSASTSGWFIAATSTGGLNFRTQDETSAGDVRITFDSDGDAGFGTLTPSEKVHVVGNLRVQGSTDCTLGNGSGATNCSSDERLKDNITPISGALEKIHQLNGVNFTWNNKSLAPGKEAIGVIAQDVQNVFPTSVVEHDTGYLAVDYASLVAPLIQATKELDNKCEMSNEQMASLQEQVNQHDRRLASLESENIELKEKNQRLESRLLKLEEQMQKLLKASE